MSEIERTRTVEPDMAASVAHCDDAAVRATGKVITGLDVQNQA
ncbi:hypothetical protein QFZ36_002667 [Pseudarthrobacter siccitolerans]|uniref:Uncharacterized protein n=1 Tax=Pseudarthrobacter siccitolerans TaxID=861266 RepID=A0ABU0PMC7_9MICC|nr:MULTISPECIES: hypothetical protein [Micrococcaceae]MDQ0675106.1 hypothetical protein [Pseudarthrobacter siccitolerans]MDQ0733359.1 hypothetical protein [Arthrobacter sp. B1I2]